jgi:hypothetical protein
MDQPSEKAESRGADQKLVYLDQFVWINLARANTDRTHPAFELLESLRALKLANRIRVPLLANHYLELWNRRDHWSREAVGDLMIELSEFETLSAIHRVREKEVADSVARWVKYGDPRAVAVDRMAILGRGAEHAFDSVTGRFRFVESIANTSAEEGEPAGEPQEFFELRTTLTWNQWQRFNLIGVPALYQFHDNGIDLRPSHRLGDSFANRHNQLRSQWDFSSDSSFLFRILAKQSLQSLRQEISDSFRADGVDPNSYFTSPTPGVAFLSTLPTENVRLNLLYDLHRDAGYRFKQHDETDITSLALAVPYCDLVFTERHWSHHLNRSGISTEYATIVPAGMVAMNHALLPMLD